MEYSEELTKSEVEEKIRSFEAALTEEALKRIGELYAIEAEIRGMPAKQRLAERQQKAKPRLKFLESWLRERLR